MPLDFPSIAAELAAIREGETDPTVRQYLDLAIGFALQRRISSIHTWVQLTLKFQARQHEKLQALLETIDAKLQKNEEQ